MIVYPRNWQTIGQEVTIDDVEERIKNALYDIRCRNLAFSGGLDSSLLLYYMCQIHDRIAVFTMGKSDKHMDVVFAKKVVDCFKKEFKVDINHYIYYPEDQEETGPIFEVFYRFVSRYVTEIISGDGIDEFMAGYYAHMEDPTEATYYATLERLRRDHLVPLNLESKQVAIYLPYLDEVMISLMSQIPLKDKVDTATRKKFLVKMAKGRIPNEVIERRKYGFCDALMENKGDTHVSN